MSLPYCNMGFSGRDFIIARRAMKDAEELQAAGHPKSALAALKKPRSVLEKKVTPIRMLALIHLQEAGLYLELGKADKALASCKACESVLEAIGDEDETLKQTIQMTKDKAGQALQKESAA